MNAQAANTMLQLTVCSFQATHERCPSLIALHQSTEWQAANEGTMKFTRPGWQSLPLFALYGAWWCKRGIQVGAIKGSNQYGWTCQPGMVLHKDSAGWDDTVYLQLKSIICMVCMLFSSFKIYPSPSSCSWRVSGAHVLWQCIKSL